MNLKGLVTRVEKKIGDKVENRPISIAIWLTITTLVLCSIITVCLLGLHWNDWLELSSIAKSGSFGDTFNGIIGPFIAFLVAILTFLAFWVQYRANEQQRLDIRDQHKRSDLESFESVFFELVRLHRENVQELSYTSFHNGELKTGYTRKVFRMIYLEFLECFHEVKKLAVSKESDSYIHPTYRKKFYEMCSAVNKEIDPIEVALIDISYSIVFFGVGVEGLSILRTRLPQRYNREFIFRVLRFVRLKPKREDASRFTAWQSARNLDTTVLLDFIEVLYRKGYQGTQIHLNRSEYEYFLKEGFDKYYSGHQHRLGHYFRHLFQTYKYLSSVEILSEKQRYQYGKNLRAQLSTYEQALLFINSISTLGARWEFAPEEVEVDPNASEEAVALAKGRARMISYYQLIKNLPGRTLNDIRYSTYYPRINFENDEG